MPDSTLKPGLTLGPYPQRPNSSRDDFELGFRRALDSLSLKKLRHNISVKKLAARVNSASHGLDLLNDKQLDNIICQLREKLQQNGLQTNLIIESFAVIREAASRSLGKRFHDVQLLGGWTMINGMIAEMETGQGKTFTTTLPACTAALAGIPVHIMTANDYLAHRDKETLAPLYDRLGLESAVLVDGQNETTRQKIYSSAIVHGSGSQFAFDYLRDQMQGANDSPKQLQFNALLRKRLGRRSPLLMRGLCFAIVDEIDSVLIDEARTPLIISQQRQNSEDQKHSIDALFLARALNEGADFHLMPNHNCAQLTNKGKRHLATLCESMAELWQRQRIREFKTEQALKALYLYKREEHYIVRDQKIMIVDPLTGRVNPDRSWDQGLHQLIEAKEGVEFTGQRDPEARITYQHFFHRYLFLTGMSGTVYESREEFNRVYGLHYRRIPTHKPTRRRMLTEQIFTQIEALRQSLQETVAELNQRGLPVLIGTRSISESKACSQWLNDCGLQHRVLNAHQDQEEADIIALAGKRGAITIATNMAGRGTDIALAEGVEELGGLQVISLGRNSARRIDRQLYGRCARQGNPGVVLALNTLQDDQVAQFYSAAILKMVNVLTGKRKRLPSILGVILVRIPQWRQECRERSQRKALLKRQKDLSTTLSFSGKNH